MDLLGINTTLHRVKTRKTQNPINTPSHFAHNPFDLLPTTLADAVAVQDDLFSLPFELNDVQAEHPTIFDLSNNSIPATFPDGGRTVAENAVAEDLLDMRGNFGDVTGQDQMSVGQGYALGTPGSSDLDFDARKWSTSQGECSGANEHPRSVRRSGDGTDDQLYIAIVRARSSSTCNSDTYETMLLRL